ncbi:MAG: efflux RND transporter permease subunit, partial [Ignavibacteriales bacterium]|nr:efflux RND transporter permease subunit [Ignavibacteriales bacterium]
MGLTEEARVVGLVARLDHWGKGHREFFTALATLKDRYPIEALIIGGGRREGEMRQLAAERYGKGPSEIQRKDRMRLVTVATNLSGSVALGEVTAAVEAAVKKAGIPPGISVFYGGDAENMRDMFSDMAVALSLAILFVYMIMVSLFESYVHPFTIMFSLPMALVGALAGLAMTGTTLSMLTMIGIVMLMGLVTKNAILLVDYTNTLRARGLNMRDA